MKYFNSMLIYCDRKFCGLAEADTFDGMFGAMPNTTVNRYSSIYT